MANLREEIADRVKKLRPAEAAIAGRGGPAPAGRVLGVDLGFWGRWAATFSNSISVDILKAQAHLEFSL